MSLNVTFVCYINIYALIFNFNIDWGAYNGYVLFGVFSKNGSFTHINSWASWAYIVPFSKIEIGCQFSSCYKQVNNSNTSATCITLFLANTNVITYKNFTQISAGSVGIRTVRKSATFKNFYVYNGTVVNV